VLTRLKVSGFKNLIDVDVYFGPFTCIAGANGTGKSNLFDAIVFLSSLADRPLTDAALSVRDEGGRMSDLRGIFHQSGNDYDRQMSFEAEMIVPPEAQDDLGQKAKASITFLLYTLSLVYHGDDGTHSPLEITKEELTHITQGQAREQLPFPHSPEWRRSAILGRRTSPFISTAGEGSDRVIRLHQEGVQGRTRQFAAANLPRTILSSTKGRRKINVSRTAYTSLIRAMPDVAARGEGTMNLTDDLKVFLNETAGTLKGSARRVFMARAVRDLGKGGQRLAEREVGWNRVQVRKGRHELESGITCVDGFALRARKRAEERLPHLLTDIRAIVDSQSQTDPQFRTRRLYTRLTAGEVRRQLIAQKGYTSAELPCERTIATKLNMLGYTLTKVAKSQPQKKSPRPTPSSPR